MPLLTRDNLDDLARRSRRYLHGVPDAPRTPQELAARPTRPRGRTVWLSVFGPTDRLAFARCFAVGLGDSRRHETGTRRVVGVATVEDHLRRELADYPPERGFVHVVAPVPESVAEADHPRYLERTDDDYRRCAGQARDVWAARDGVSHRQRPGRYEGRLKGYRILVRYWRDEWCVHIAPVVGEYGRELRRADSPERGAYWARRWVEEHPLERRDG